MITRLRARFDGKVLVPEEQVDLPTDRVLELQVRDEEPQATPPQCPDGASLERRYQASDKSWIDPWLADDNDPTQPD